ncbi:AAA domain-containing protein [Clostridium sp. OS1-26]|uniref:AAA domain-containing protein n=1 Tax=Clostridium sp. OS1-26 TaxID=3070681 RepID=UPI0027E0E8CD|nr:AAA domain-containing protein [Clostridium sp. OS1-26]WML36530.1 AAA domain-containing protein [Clostridium sp. OS1-26]
MCINEGKKAIIVGDDKQISPEVIGIDQGFIHELINKHLRDIPQNEWFDLQTSLYDTALRVFPNRLMLREHFRCVPEIIKFSNDNCYAGDMKPLRYLKSYEAFYPPVVPVKIDSGYREQNKPINIPEAEFIANKVAECCRDRRYTGMTMGAISLLGESQGELIESMIREKIGEEEMIKRKLICGDAYSFQGDERDIMFLSMVISNNVKFTSLTKESDVRRFNVAASRARNQMWLIYSIDLEELNPECIRYSLLNYCLNYDKINCNNTNINYAFQSRFQKDVYNMISDEGIKLVPQVKIGRYKIDFVVEGSTNKIAIICEGEMLSENYDWEERLEVQIGLERIGWTFLRIRPSEFYYNPEKTMDRLWQKLKNNDMEQYKNKNLIAEQLKVV